MVTKCTGVIKVVTKFTGGEEYTLTVSLFTNHKRNHPSLKSDRGKYTVLVQGFTLSIMHLRYSES